MTTRRSLLAAGLGAASLPVLNACGVGGGTADNSGDAAGEVTGGFDWKKASGTKLKILQTPHPYQQAFQPLLKDFTALTGIEVQADLVAEADYFTKLNTELAGRTGAHDVFMTGAYFIWQYGPPGWMEDLNPWLQNTSATSPDYDFDDIYEGLRTSTRWDFKPGSPLGTGGQWAIPWGFETNVLAYNKRIFDQRGIKPAESFDELIQLATDLTDRSKNQYGIAFRGSKSWASIHPGYMTQFSREGGKDYTAEGGKLVAAMNSPQAVEFTRKWVNLAKAAGPTSWTTYEYPDATRDLGNGNAVMVYDADSATYPKNRPGASKEAGNLAWHPGPPGPDGSYATNLWTWSLAMNAASKQKLAAWLFIQWATGKEAMSNATKSAFADPTRKSVFDGSFKQTLGGFPGYLETFEKVVDQTKIQFTPQTKFFETTEDWAVALQDIYAGQDAKARLDALAESNTKKLAS
ncbi:ABC transporter substrate-binding protein [Spirilliplanes yamanashiensis]|uniref:Erythritol/L-threitol-binding protein n=1 Tax=Spirilliplanes yamanashiensis TaxID=42233 RepID=A0A8J3Y9K3_9ACTN|nr:sugar ABC transporter substrate-binding protein [Spirilliplanes yamanashiensis]MDP9817603.1 multiple sugar transport system substrate-binding protein [Spirilliplanes yamanashiensis]GIJ04413.1 erythritol/L-threitol-binding protein [Spirilliplanes yamanashiensis]